MSAVIHDDKSLGQLVGDLVTETRTLITQEIQLAKTEVSEKVSFVGRNATSAAIGGFVALLGALPIIAGIVIALGHKIGYATSSFIVGAVFVIIGAVLIMKAVNALKSTPLAPEQTKAQIKETKEWAKDQMR
jgi:VIT1/CCC1 family predicted Fe2+/Mn2+ transporter